MKVGKGLRNKSILSGIEHIEMKEVDLNDPEVKARLAYVLKAQKETLARKNIDRQKLNTVIVRSSCSNNFTKGKTNYSDRLTRTLETTPDLKEVA